jgi:SulP family sulfate permease
MKRMSDIKHVISLEARLPEQSIEVYKMRGPFFFGVTDRLKNLILQMETPPKTIVLRMKHVPILDASAMQALREINHRCQTKGSKLVLIDVQPEPTELLKGYGLGDLIGSSIPGPPPPL